ncbi:MAG: universal stress protein, partial [Acidobacteriota bacterium]|nr:universal stress protein [Acidobacteriota bacterium]
VLVASDGSLSATAAVVSARRFPWPEATLAFVAIAREHDDHQERPAVRASLDRAAEIVAESTVEALRGRWPDVRVNVIKGLAADAIVKRAKAVGADVIVLSCDGDERERRLGPGEAPRAHHRRRRRQRTIRGN